MFPHAYFTPAYFPHVYFPVPGPRPRIRLIAVRLVLEPAPRVTLSAQSDLCVTLRHPSEPPAMPPEQTLRMIRAQDLIVKASLAPPRDAADWTIIFEVKDSLGGTSVLSRTIGSGIVAMDPGQGVFHVLLAKDDTLPLTVSARLDPGKGYVWSIKRVDPGFNLVLARGQLILEEEVTA